MLSAAVMLVPWFESWVQTKSGVVPTFDELDTNQDGVIDRSEFSAGMYGVLRDQMSKELLIKTTQDVFPSLPVIAVVSKCFLG